jgi:ferredoxin
VNAKVDPTQCIGCELCVQLCPDVFGMEDNLATVIVDVIAPDLEAACRDCASQCPVSAIVLSE